MKKIIIGIALLGLHANATYPDANHQCSHKLNKIKYGNVQNIPNIDFDSTCTVAFVAPPSLGKLKVLEKPGLHTRVKECGIVDNLIDVNFSLSLDLKHLSERRSLLQAAVNEAHIRIEGYKDSRIEKEIQLDEVKKQINVTQQEITVLNRQKVLVKDKLVDCRRHCHRLEKHLMDLEEKILSREESLIATQDRISSLEIDIDRLTMSIDSELVEYEADYSELSAVLGDILNLMGQINTLKEQEYGKYAATFKVNLDLDWDGLVEHLQDNNQHLGITFTKLNINSSQFYLNQFDIENNAAYGSVLLNRYVPSATFNILGSLDPDKASKTPKVNLLYAPDISLELNMGGTCRLLDKNYEFDINKAPEVSVYLNPAVAYEYLVRQNLGYKISYNMHKSLDKISQHIKEHESFLWDNVSAANWLVDFSSGNLQIENPVAQRNFLNDLRGRHLRAILDQLLEIDTVNNSNMQSCPTCLSVSYTLEMSSAEFDKKIAEIKALHGEIVTEESQGALFTKRTGQINFR